MIEGDPVRDQRSFFDARTEAAGKSERTVWEDERKKNETGSIFLYGKRTGMNWKRTDSDTVDLPYTSDLQFSGNTGIQFSGSRRIWC